MISKFPSFSRLEIHHKNSVDEITSRYVPYSDFNFTSLFSWNTSGSTAISLLNGNLVIKMPDYSSAQIVYSLLGNKMIDESLVKLLALTPQLKLVPEDTIKSIRSPRSFILCFHKNPITNSSSFSNSPFSLGSYK